MSVDELRQRDWFTAAEPALNALRNFGNMREDGK
jgi:hypothetical protein